MITSEYLEKHFYDKFYNLDEATILKLRKTYTDGGINNVVVGLDSNCYGIGLIDDLKSLDYYIFFINGDKILTGELLVLNIDDPERERLLTIFSMHLADKYHLDIIETFNTFQTYTRTMCEQVNYLTITSDDLLEYNNPSIIAKNVNSIITFHILHHLDLYKFLFGKVEIIVSQPGDSYVYLMYNKRNNLVKIGKSVNPRHREKTLQSEEPEITMVALWKTPNKLERYLHRLYKHRRIRGEWFELSFKELKELKVHVSEFIAQNTVH